MDASVTIPVIAGQFPTASPLTFADAMIFIRGVTVDNNSPVTVGLYVGNANASGTPSFSIGPWQTKTIPIQATKVIGIGFSGDNTSAGSIYIHYVDVTLPSSVSSNSTPILRVPTLLSTVIARGDSNSFQLTQAYTIGNAPDPTNNTISDGIWISDLLWQIVGPTAIDENVLNFQWSNARTGHVGSGIACIPNQPMNSNFTRPLPFYTIGKDYGARIGDTIALEFSWDQAFTATPWYSAFTANLLLS